MAMKIRRFFKKTYDDIFGSLIFIFVFLSLSFIPCKLYYVSSFFHKGILFVIIFWFIFKIFYSLYFYFKNKKSPFLSFENIIFSLCLITITLSLIGIFISAKGRSFNINSFNKFFMLLESVIVIACFSTGKFSKHIMYVLIIGALISSMLLAILFLSGVANAHEGFNKWKGLTLNYSNPNLAGLVTSTYILILIFGIFYIKNIILRILFGLLIIANSGLYFLTSARASIFAIFLALIFFFLYFIFRKRNINLFVSYFLPLFPMIFAILYFIFYALYLPNGAYSVSYDIVIFGKYLGSRYEVWRDAFTLVSSPKTFLFGTYYDGCSSGALPHNHNGILDIFVTYGMLTFISFICFLSSCILKVLRKSNILILSSAFGIVFIFFTFLIGISESSPFYSSNGMFALWFSPLLMIRYPRGKSILVTIGEKPFKKTDNGGILLVSNVYGTGSIGKLVQSSHLDNLNKNIRSYVLYGRGEQSLDKNVVCIEDIWDVAFAKLKRNLFSRQWVGTKLMTGEIIMVIKDMKPDIVHVHAVNDDFVNYKKLFKYLSKHNIKTVYTNHSEWMYVGSCGGHAYSCTKYISEKCFACPRNYSNACVTFNLKNKLISSFKKENLVITSVSPWLDERSRNSMIFKDYSNNVVLNGNDIGSYEPSFNSVDEFLVNYKTKDNKEGSSNNEDKPIYIKTVLFVTPSLSNELKGFRYVIELANKNPSIHFVAVSLQNDWKDTIPNNITLITGGVSKNDLATLYTYSDLTILTSEQETFSMPVAESLTCGTPVVGFLAGGPESIALGNGASSFVKYGDIEALNIEMNNMLKKKFKKEAIKKVAIEKYSVETMAKEYRKVYSKLDSKYGNI